MIFRIASRPLGIALLWFALYVAMWAMYQGKANGRQSPEISDRVVLSAPLQLLMSGGDRFLAANFESIRVVATAQETTETAESNTLFGIRARRVVAQLNPCHEDNYYLGNALLTFGGAVQEGNNLLKRATACRTWDAIPPYFYGFNQYFFLRDIAGARESLEVAAQRSQENAAAMRKLAIMIAVGEFDDDNAALKYLRSELERASDPKLREMLTKRVDRLSGLITLRDAQKYYEHKFGKPLSDPEQLIIQGILGSFPIDPMGLGYEFHEGSFRLRSIQVVGLEGLQ